MSLHKAALHLESRSLLSARLARALCNQCRCLCVCVRVCVCVFTAAAQGKTSSGAIPDQHHPPVPVEVLPKNPDFDIERTLGAIHCWKTDYWTTLICRNLLTLDIKQKFLKTDWKYPVFPRLTSLLLENRKLSIQNRFDSCHLSPVFQSARFGLPRAYCDDTCRPVSLYVCMLNWGVGNSTCWNLARIIFRPFQLILFLAILAPPA